MTMTTPPVRTRATQLASNQSKIIGEYVEFSAEDESSRGVLVTRYPDSDPNRMYIELSPDVPWLEVQERELRGVHTPDDRHA